MGALYCCSCPAVLNQPLVQSSVLPQSEEHAGILTSKQPGQWALAVTAALYTCGCCVGMCSDMPIVP